MAGEPQVQRGDEPLYIKLAPRRDLQRSFPKGHRAQSRIGNGPISVGYPAHKDARPECDRRGPSSVLSGCRNVLGSSRGHLAVAGPRVVIGDLQEIRMDKPRVHASEEISNRSHRRMICICPCRD